MNSIILFIYLLVYGTLAYITAIIYNSFDPVGIDGYGIGMVTGMLLMTAIEHINLEDKMIEWYEFISQI